MAKKIAEKASDASVKKVEIQHLKAGKDDKGNDVNFVDRTEVLLVDVAIEDAEAQLVNAEARVSELKSDIAEYKKIKG
tara:strand:+ start:393 stop:626 length:234 start_codon:yes stop_codon:yes gene_type:complete